MTTLTLNIGLNVGDHVPLNQEHRTLLAIDHWFLPRGLRQEVRQSATEQTLVLEFRTYVSNPLNAIEDICHELQQDAIAGTLDGVGFLVGPRAAEWGGAFNPEFFINPSWS